MKYKIISETVKQPVNREKTESTYLEQRIKILIPKHLAESPVVLFILGNEIAISDSAIKKCFKMYGQRSDIIFLLAEHRGYGKSVSPDKDQTIPRYVSVDQALTDYHAVAEEYQKKYTYPWIAAGYSYGGGLAINYGFKYPEDVQVILSSSGVVNWSFLLDFYEDQVKENLGRRLYGRLVKHVEKLARGQVFDRKWESRELIYSFVSGISQNAQYNKSMKKIIAALSLLPTNLFIRTLKLIDLLLAKGAAKDYVASNSKVNLSISEARTCKYGWRVWRYQQFFETGTLWSYRENGLYRNSMDEWIKECNHLFREDPPLLTKPEWNVREMADQLQIPLVYVNGGKDPWKGVCLPVDFRIRQGACCYFEDSFHCPDREVKNGVKVIGEILKYINQ